MPFPLTSAEEVNQWVLNATNGHIPNFLSDIQSDVVLMLMNAMYFKGETVLLLFDVKSFLLTFHCVMVTCPDSRVAVSRALTDVSKINIICDNDKCAPHFLPFAHISR